MLMLPKLGRGMGGCGRAGGREKSFDEFSPSTLWNVRLHARQRNQAGQFCDDRHSVERLYVYDGAQIDQYVLLQLRTGPQRSGLRHGVDKRSGYCRSLRIRHQSFGIALPQGRLRFYRRDSDGSLRSSAKHDRPYAQRRNDSCLYGNAFESATASATQLSRGFECALDG